jgi:hypothetical protein
MAINPDVAALVLDLVVRLIDESIDAEDFQALRDKISTAIDRLDEPKPERLVNRAERLEARAIELRIRAAKLSAN